MDYGVVFCITTPQICCNCGRTLFDFYLNSANKSALKPLKISPVVYILFSIAQTHFVSHLRICFRKWVFCHFLALLFSETLLVPPPPLSPQIRRGSYSFVDTCMWWILWLRSYVGFCIQCKFQNDYEWFWRPVFYKWDVADRNSNLWNKNFLCAAQMDSGEKVVHAVYGRGRSMDRHGRGARRLEPRPREIREKTAKKSCSWSIQSGQSSTSWCT